MICMFYLDEHERKILGFSCSEFAVFTGVILPDCVVRS